MPLFSPDIAGIVASNTTYTSGTIVLTGGANVTVTTNASTISIVAAGFSAGVSTGGSTQGSTGVTGSRIVFVGTGGLVLSQDTAAAGATITFDGQNRTMSSWFHNSAALYSSSLFAHIDNTVSLAHIQIPQDISFSRVDWPVSISVATNSNNTSFGFMQLSAVYVLYTRNASTLLPIVGGSSTTTYTWQSVTGVYSSLTGPRMMSFPLATALTPGDYWMGVQLITVSNAGSGAASTALRGTISPIVGTSYSVLPFQDMSASTAGTNNLIAPFQGLNSVSISNTTMTHQLTQMTHTNTHGIRANMVFIFRNL